MIKFFRNIRQKLQRENQTSFSFNAIPITTANAAKVTPAKAGVYNREHHILNAIPATPAKAGVH